MEYKSPSIIEACAEMLRKPVPTNGEDAEIHLIEIDALRYDVADACAKALRMLYQKRQQVLWPKDKDKTELDRTTYMNGAVAIIEHDYLLLQKIEVLLKDRLAICMMFIH